MNSVKKTCVITRKQHTICSYLLHDQRALEIHCDPMESGILGNIYIGKVKNIAANIGAAFVEIAPGSICYLPLEDVLQPIYTQKGSSAKLQAGDELLVQVTRDAIKTKAPAVTTNLSFHGKLILLTTGKTHTAASSKLSKEKRAELIALADGQSTALTGTFGWLFRTNAGSATKEELLAEMAFLHEQYLHLMKTANYRTVFSCLYQTPAPYLKRLSDLYDSDAETILTDDPTLYQELEDYLRLNQPGDLPKLKLYQDKLLPMEKLYSLETQYTQALSERVWLKSGAYLIIQPTEALTVIDVNTGKYEGGKKKEAAFLKVNTEAAIEIARQLRLRNLSGIIIVDFINMETEESRTALLSVLEKELKKDPLRTVLVDMTRLFLVEITRMKKEKPLAEQSREWTNL